MCMLGQVDFISIHALREEGDFHFAPDARPPKNFYPRPPRGGRRERSTPASRHRNFYPRPPRGGRPVILLKRHFRSNFYPRPPRGGRLMHRESSTYTESFLSTPSARRATIPRFSSLTDRWISIHALREEGDAIPWPVSDWKRIFLSTPSARRATAKTERKPSAFVSLYTSLHKLQRGACKANHKITPLLAKTAVIPVRSVQKNHVHCLFALAGHHPDIKRSAHYPVQTPGAVQRARPWSGNCCPAGRTADCPRQGRSGRSALP